MKRFTNFFLVLVAFLGIGVSFLATAAVTTSHSTQANKSTITEKKTDKLIQQYYKENRLRILHNKRLLSNAKEIDKKKNRKLLSILLLAKGSHISRDKRGKWVLALPNIYSITTFFRFPVGRVVSSRNYRQLVRDFRKVGIFKLSQSYEKSPLNAMLVAGINSMPLQILSINYRSDGLVYFAIKPKRDKIHTFDSNQQAALFIDGSSIKKSLLREVERRQKQWGNS